MPPDRENQLLDELARALEPPKRELEPARVQALRAKAEQARTAEPQTSAPEPRRGIGLRLRFVLPAVAAVAAACLAIGIVIGGNGDSTPALGGEVEYDGGIALGDASGTLRIADIGVGREVDLETDDLPILPKGEFYEVWFVGAGDSPGNPNRISAGTFHPDANGNTEIRLTAAVDPTLYPEVLVTAERGNGDPHPSEQVVLRADVG